MEDLYEQMSNRPLTIHQVADCFGGDANLALEFIRCLKEDGHEIITQINNQGEPVYRLARFPFYLRALRDYRDDAGNCPRISTLELGTEHGDDN